MSDRWFLDTLSDDYSLELSSVSLIFFRNLGTIQKHLLMQKAIQHIPNIGMIESVPVAQRTWAVYSVLSVIPKNGDIMAILDLRWLNRDIRRKKL